MHKVTILGAGHIGRMIATDLAASGAYEVTLADRNRAVLDAVSSPGFECRVIDAADPAALRRGLAGQDIVVSACPFFLNAGIAEAARDGGLHYFDLTEDTATMRAIRTLAEGAATAFVPQCGLAPGFIGIAGHEMARAFDRARSVHMRVGALPLYPSNALKYNLTWSTDGLINEYCNPCDAVREGRQFEVLALEGLDRFSLDGVDYEAFNTSGGLGTLAETLAGEVESLDYKTIRYPGHRDLIKMLLDDLGLRHDRATLRRIFERSVPETEQDVVIIVVNAVGERAGRLAEESFVRKVYGTPGRSAIQATTSAGLCAMLELFLAGKLPRTGFVRQEDARLPDFLATRAGAVFDAASNRAGLAA